MLPHIAIPPPHGGLSVVFAVLSPRLAEEIGYQDSFASGIIVTRMSRRAYRMRIVQPRDIITEQAFRVEPSLLGTPSPPPPAAVTIITQRFQNSL